ncbi:hypothetical protein BLNAU_3535 [Blattamonas nauphoetae]|uniref:Uncharacterized protein n=1 Tax=Blattamonas nauphoetae TaxID=2049346 RepID=A0ABQ9YCT9_9EUKA|nr:hypothetical protein BLNAU_3535 [Blattamonas nauphoetae]
MTPAFVEKSLSLVSPNNNKLTKHIFNIFYWSVDSRPRLGDFLKECNSELVLMNYLAACQPTSLDTNPNSFCATFSVDKDRESPIHLCFKLLCKVIEDESLPEDLPPLYLSSTVPYILCSTSTIRNRALSFLQKLAVHKQNIQIVNFSLPHNPAVNADSSEVSVLTYLIHLMREKQEELTQLVRVSHVLNRIIHARRPTLPARNRNIALVEKYEESVQTTLEREIISCLKTLARIPAFLSRFISTSEENEMIMINSGAYPFVGQFLRWALFLLSPDHAKLGIDHLEGDYQSFLTACTTPEYILPRPFNILDQLKSTHSPTRLKQQFTPPNTGQDGSVPNPTEQHNKVLNSSTVFTAKQNMTRELLFFLSNAFSGTAEHVDILLASLFPEAQAVEAKIEVMNCLTTMLSYASHGGTTEAMQCIRALACGPADLQLLLIQTGTLIQAWNARTNFNENAIRCLADTFIVLLLKQDSEHAPVATALVEQMNTEAFRDELHEMCQSKQEYVKRHANRMWKRFEGYFGYSNTSLPDEEA